MLQKSHIVRDAIRGKIKASKVGGTAAKVVNSMLMMSPSQLSSKYKCDPCAKPFLKLCWMDDYLKFQVGLRLVIISSFVPASSFGRRLRRWAPARRANAWAWDMPLRPLRMLPASLPLSMLRRRAGGAKSRAVKVPDFLKRWLWSSRLVLCVCDWKKLLTGWA